MTRELPNGRTEVSGNCVFTGRAYSCVVPTRGLLRWLEGERIQAAMPEVPAPDREFLISGISPSGWKETFGSAE